MSYDIRFKVDGETCQIPFAPPHGGIFVLDDTNFRAAWLNITFNYSNIFAAQGVGIVPHTDDKPGTEVLLGKTASEVVAILARVIPTLGNDVDDNYWAATEGNAKAALINLMAIAIAVSPDAVCEVEY